MSQVVPVIGTARAATCLAALGAIIFGSWTNNAFAQGGATADAQAAPALSWQIRDVPDKMTDKVIRKAVSGGTFNDGVALEAYAYCGNVGIEFAFDTFRNRDPAPFARNEDAIDLRLRFDKGAVRNTQAKATYTNEAQILFYDPVTMERLLRDSVNHGQDRDSLVLGSFHNAMTSVMLQQLEAAAAGKLIDLANASSIRVELPLANGSAYVVDLNPQDQALATVVRQCADSLHADIESARQAEQAKQDAQRRAEQERVAKLNEERHKAALAVKRNKCAPGQELFVLYAASIHSLDEFDPQKAHAPVASILAPDGAKVVVLNEAGLDLPPNAIPDDRCAVSYVGPQGRFVGTLPTNIIATIETYNAAHETAQQPVQPRMAQPSTPQCPPGQRPDLLGRCQPPYGFGR